MTLWRAIADTLRKEITRGQWRPGQRLPAEAELAARFGVNRHTLRHATRVLSDEGLLYARRGAGVFVAATPVEYQLGKRVRFHRNIEVLGKVPGRQIDSVMTRAASATEADALELPKGAKVHVIEGVATVDHRPVALFSSTFPARPLPDLPVVLKQHASITAALASCGIGDVQRARTRITARIANETQAAKLQMDAGEALLRTETMNVADGHPIERGLTWWVAERVTLSLDNQS